MRLFSKRIIQNFAGDPYLIRYTIISTRWFRLFVHKILRSDDDRDLHDHPWPFWTLILWGRYREETPVDSPPMFDHCGKMIVKSRICRPGTLVRHRASDCHRLELAKPVWTLFFAGGRTRDWGFHTPEGWVQWEEYINSRTGVDVSDMEDC